MGHRRMTPLQELIDEHVKLTDIGYGHYVARCPECRGKGKLLVGESDWQCYDCGVSGTSLVQFVVLWHRVSLRKAIDMLAERGKWQGRQPRRAPRDFP